MFLLREAASLTFQHFDGHLGHPVRLLLVQAERLAHHHLTEAAFAQRLSENQSAQIKSHQMALTQRWLSRVFSLPRVVGGFPGLTCPGGAPSGGPGAARTQTPLTASENRWRRGGRGGPASHLSGWRSWSPRRPEEEETDITPLIVEQTPANNQLDGDKNLICLNCLALCFFLILLTCLHSLGRGRECL